MFKAPPSINIQLVTRNAFKLSALFGGPFLLR
jgi:hypothetical protein